MQRPTILSASDRPFAQPGCTSALRGREAWSAAGWRGRLARPAGTTALRDRAAWLHPAAYASADW